LKLKRIAVVEPFFWFGSIPKKQESWSSYLLE
jgi:hypothetical protein